MGVANFYAKYQQAIYDSYYMSYFGEDMWNQDMYGNGSTMTEDVKQEAAEALAALGYSPAEAMRAVKEAEITDGMDAEDILKKALKKLL